MCEEHTQLWPSFFYVQNTDISEHQLICAEHKYFLLFFSVRRTQIFFTIIFCVQNTVNNGRHLQCAEHRQFSPSCCVCRTQTILTAMLCVENTDNFNGHAVCTEHRQFSPSCCVCRTQTNRTQTNRTQTILTVMCVQNTNRTQAILAVILCVQNTDKRNTDNSHCRFVRAEHRQTEHRQFSLSVCACRTQLGGGVDTSISGADNFVW